MSTANHSTPSSNDKSTAVMCIWFFHDHRLGHLKQLQGLAARLERHADIVSCWLDIRDYALGLRHLLVTPNKLNALPHPNMIIGAGHKTHLSVLLAARYYQAFSVLVMKPSLPLSWFDAIICPKHDRVSPAANVLQTFGPLNTLMPPEMDNPTARSHKLILIGGPSRHFRFDTDTLLCQIQALCQETPHICWLLSNSPRTPAAFMTQLKALVLPNLMIKDYQDPELPALETLLLTSERVWLTPDSMAMIFEALTAGASVGVFEARVAVGKARSRIYQQIDMMLRKQELISFDNRARFEQEANKPSRMLRETDRAARWLLQQYTSRQIQAAEADAGE